MTSPKRPQIACICGSTSQRAAMNELNRRLTMNGLIVVAPGVFQHDGDPLTDEEKERLDHLHFAKIDLADEVHFIPKADGTFGTSTTREYAHATATKDASKVITWRELAGMVRGGRG